MIRFRNQLLASLSEDDLGLISGSLRRCSLKAGSLLFEEGGEVDGVYFPEDGIVSLIVPLKGGEAIEAGMIGRDGVVGASAALDGEEAISRAVVLIRIDAWCIDTDSLKKAAASSSLLRRALYRNEQRLLAKAQQSVACNAAHTIEQRLCRFLLRAHDLVYSAELPFTQESLGQMLAVRRTSVTLAARQLQSAGLIKYRRGSIQILDLDELKSRSCECFAGLSTQKDDAAQKENPAPADANELNLSAGAGRQA